MGDHVDPGPPLVVALHHVPGRLRGVGVQEHLVLGPRVVLPAGDRLDVHRRELPALHRVRQALPEAPLLLGVADREPVLAQQQAGLGEHPLEDRGLVQELPVLLLGAEAHHPLDPGAVVPAAVEQHDLPGGGQVLDVPLEVPLGALALGRRGQCGDPGDARVQILRHPLDRAALAGRVAPLEDHHQPGTLGPHPLLELHQLVLEPEQFALVRLPRQPPPRTGRTVLDAPPLGGGLLALGLGCHLGASVRRGADDPSPYVLGPVPAGPDRAAPRAGSVPARHRRPPEPSLPGSPVDRPEDRTTHHDPDLPNGSNFRFHNLGAWMSTPVCCAASPRSARRGS